MATNLAVETNFVALLLLFSKHSLTFPRSELPLGENLGFVRELACLFSPQDSHVANNRDE
jgi:hypothetical protein